MRGQELALLVLAAVGLAIALDVLLLRRWRAALQKRGVAAGASQRRAHLRRLFCDALLAEPAAPAPLP